MVNIAVLVSGGGTNLQALLDAERRGEIKNGKITLVLSSVPDVYALERARLAGVDTLVVDRKGKKRETFTRKLLEALRERDIGLIVFAGFMCIVDPSLCEAYENRIINVHPALIPAFCGEGYYGMHVHEQVLAYGVKLTGATVHFSNEETDGGPIILQKSIAVREDDTPESLQRRVMEQCEWELLPRAVSLFCEGRLSVEGRRVHILPEASAGQST